MKREVVGFRDLLRGAESSGCGQISLEFYQKKPARWPFPAECIPWEVWTVKLDILTLANEHGKPRPLPRLLCQTPPPAPPFPAECIPWEVWTVKLDILTLANEHGKNMSF